tara:strand:+ start:1430 stop:1642 length:213 start_codon:yes stop_codon:yes gene_type:complete
MNEARYSIKYDVFIAHPEEDIQMTQNDMMVYSRNICGYAVFQIVFFELSDMNPMYKLKKETIANECTNRM